MITLQPVLSEGSVDTCTALNFSASIVGVGVPGAKVGVGVFGTGVCVGVGGTGVRVGGTGVCVGGIAVGVGGTGVCVGRTGVFVAVGRGVGLGTTGVSVVATRVVVAGNGVWVGGTEAAVGGTTVEVGEAMATTVGVGLGRPTMTTAPKKHRYRTTKPPNRAAILPARLRLLNHCILYPPCICGYLSSPLDLAEHLGLCESCSCHPSTNATKERQKQRKEP